MGYVDDIEPGLTALMESRRLFLRERKPARTDPPDEVFIQVGWDDGLRWDEVPVDDDSGLPVGYVMRTGFRRRGLVGRTVEFWTAYAVTESSRPGGDMYEEIGTLLPDVNEAVRAVLRRLPFRYS
ncbi:hypothetical protein AB0D57_36560 [Streptomyces sp. NPDC048275]|uniref:hypothetical protein n=1 Tax=Streptomyces sp. NPDC048275 TaxID=3155629 RepID=UPI0033F25C69